MNDKTQTSKILIIDDDEIYRKVTADILKNNNFDVYSAASGAEGLKLAAEKLPDLILLDLMMPDENGLILLEKIRKDSATQKLPVLMVSNISAARDMAKDYPDTDFLLKSKISGEQLLDKINEILNKRSS